MADGLPGWTCPDIDATKRMIRRWHDRGMIPTDERDAAFLRLEALRSSNRQLRERCAELLQDRSRTVP